jgi:hypothetical protein
MSILDMFLAFGAIAPSTWVSYRFPHAHIGHRYTHHLFLGNDHPAKRRRISVDLIERRSGLRRPIFQTFKIIATNKIHQTKE